MTAGAGALARAQAIGVPGEEVDGNDVLVVDAAVGRLIADIRAGKGPRFLHAITYRFKGHVSVDPATYRDGEEVARALQDDPLKRVWTNLTAGEVERIHRDAEEEVRKALAAAAAAPWPSPEQAYTDIQDTGSGRWRG
jgi:pyruvate dehydrogenase E1 component alpha subunit